MTWHKTPNSVLTDERFVVLSNEAFRLYVLGNLSKGDRLESELDRRNA